MLFFVVARYREDNNNRDTNFHVDVVYDQLGFTEFTKAASRGIFRPLEIY